MDSNVQMERREIAALVGSMDLTELNERRGSICVAFSDDDAEKSSLFGLLAADAALVERDVLSVDMGGHYGGLCAALGGNSVSIKIPTQKNVCLWAPFRTGFSPSDETKLTYLLGAIIGDEAKSPTLAEILSCDGRRYSAAAIVDLADLAPMIERAELEALKTALDESIRTPASGGRRRVSPFFSSDVAGASGALRKYGRRGSASGIMGGEISTLNNLALNETRWTNFDLSALDNKNGKIVLSVLLWFIYEELAPERRGADILVDGGTSVFQNPLFPEFARLLESLAIERGHRVLFLSPLYEVPAEWRRFPMRVGALVGRGKDREKSRSFFASLGAIDAPEVRAAYNAKFISQLPRGGFAVGSLFQKDPLEKRFVPSQEWLNYCATLSDGRGWSRT